MNALKYAIIFAGGFAAGAWFMFSKLKGEFEEALTSETKATRDYYHNMYEEDVKAAKEKMPSVSELKNETKVPEDEKEFADKIFKSTINKLEYSKIFSAGVDLAEVEHPEEDKPEPQPAYIISQSDFMASSYEQRTVTYYETLDILAEDYDVLDNVNYIVGTEFKEHFGDEELDVVYVRNEKMGTDFEIIRDHSDPKTVRGLLGYEGGPEG